MKLLPVLALALAFTSPVAAAPPEKLDRWTDYTRTAAPGPLYGLTLTSTVPARFVDGDGPAHVFAWGDHVRLTCRGSSWALICALQDPEIDYDQISLGEDSECGTGCGHFDDSSGPSEISGPARCRQILSGHVEYLVVTKNSLRFAPTYRTGRCIGQPAVGDDAIPVGAPCDSDGDCGESQTCTKDGVLGSLGVYLYGLGDPAASSETPVRCTAEVVQ